MAEPVFYMRGVTPGGGPLNPEIASDAASINRVTDKTLEEIRIELLNYQGFLDKEAFYSLIAKFVRPNLGSPADSARQLARFLWFVLSPPFPDAEKFHQRFVSVLRKWQEQNSSDQNCPLTAEDVDQIAARLTPLLQEFPAIVRQRKAERLEKTTGQFVERFELICDLRPIFDESRKNVEGLVPITHLKFVIATESGLPTAFEVVLSETQVKSLFEASESAIRKLESLKQFATHSHTFVPLVELTKRDDSHA